VRADDPKELLLQLAVSGKGIAAIWVISISVALLLSALRAGYRRLIRLCESLGAVEQSEAAPMANLKLIVGGGLEDDAAAFLDAWHRAQRGRKARARSIAFESWEGLAGVLTGERYRLLRHLHAHPEPSVSSLARSLGRQYRRVHADVKALEKAGLLARVQGGVRTTADAIKADIRL
jgi:predicted transcriptional regulator